MGQNVVLFVRWDLNCGRSHQYVSCFYRLIFGLVFLSFSSQWLRFSAIRQPFKTRVDVSVERRYLVEKSFKTPHSLCVACCVEPHHILVIVCSQDFLLQSAVPSSILQRDSSLILSCSSKMLNICFIIVCLYERQFVSVWRKWGKKWLYLKGVHGQWWPGLKTSPITICC